MCMDGLPICISVNHIYAVDTLYRNVFIPSL